MALRKYDVHIERTTPSEDSKLVVVQFPSIRSQLDRDPDELALSVMSKSLKMKIDLSNAKNTYLSTKNDIDDSQLFVCKVVNDRLVCQPVSQIVTVRPDFSELNPKEEVDANEEIRPVSVKFSANDRHHAQDKYQRQVDSEEETEVFLNYSFRHLRVRHSTLRRDALFGKQVQIKPDPDENPVDSKLSVKMEVDDVKPKVNIGDVKHEVPVTPKMSENTKQRVKDCLTRAKLASFEEIYCFLEQIQKSSHETQPILKKDIIDALNECGVLVQGNWAIKSEILYGDSVDRESTDVTGIPINLFTAARDYLLWLFDQKRTISRPAYTRRVRLPDYDVLELFNQLAHFRPALKKWEFKLPTDKKFISDYPDIANRQKTVWRVTRNNKLKIFD